MLWFAIHILLFILIVLLLRPIVEGMKNKTGKKSSKKSVLKSASESTPESAPIAPSAFKSASESAPISATESALKSAPKSALTVNKTGVKNKKMKKKVSFAPVPTSYADLVKQPYTGNNFTSIQSDIREYQKALDGKKSSKMTIPGMMYFHNTGTKCPNINQDRHIVIDSRSNANLFDSANADIVKSSQFTNPSYSATDCKLVTIDPIDIYGRILPKQSKYI